MAGLNVEGFECLMLSFQSRTGLDGPDTGGLTTKVVTTNLDLTPKVITPNLADRGEGADLGWLLLRF
ncbi:hypothetical protein OOK60_03435 [Trichothermofontia sichuanensis B231]|uniref:hypothetical protein n=1 Tax=Trichothermofontia sichuanensis TaxID=3045816 RepID=UPI0022471C20|nr:hypothetical protein [Trichothermofontia sichuanensis]UZQ55142.1 hypothetical protein OOK60_03435 [Trichothermofontia sichuanensis B231]